MKKDISFYSEGEKISGHLYEPKNIDSNKRYPAIILCHGFAGIKELLLPAFAQKFSGNGFIALCFDYRGFGESEGTRGNLIKNNQIADIRNAITYIQTVDNVDPDKIGLWGTSYGGANSIEVTSIDKRVKCLCVQVTFGNGRRVIFQGKPHDEEVKMLETINKVWKRKVTSNKDLAFGLNKFLTDEQSLKFYENNINAFPQMDVKISFMTMKETIEHTPENHIGNVNIPVLFIGAENDLVNPVEETKSLFNKANEPKTMEIIKGAGHYDVYEGEVFERVAEFQINWFKKYLA